MVLMLMSMMSTSRSLRPVRSWRTGSSKIDQSLRVGCRKFADIHRNRTSSAPMNLRKGALQKLEVPVWNFETFDRCYQACWRAHILLRTKQLDINFINLDSMSWTQRFQCSPVSEAIENVATQDIHHVRVPSFLLTRNSKCNLSVGIQIESELVNHFRYTQHVNTRDYRKISLLVKG